MIPDVAIPNDLEKTLSSQEYLIPFPVRAIVKTLRIFRLFRNGYDTCKKHPADYAVGAIGALTLKNIPAIQFVARAALITRCTLDVADAQKLLIRSWEDLSLIDSPIPLNVIRQIRGETLVARLPSPLALTCIKVQDAAYVLGTFAAAIARFINAWDALYCACTFDTLTGFQAKAEIVRNIREIYTRFITDNSALTGELLSIAAPLKFLLQQSDSPTIAALNKRLAVIEHLDTNVDKAKIASTMSFLGNLGQKMAFIACRIGLNPPAALLPVSAPKDTPKQPILEPRAHHGNHSRSDSTCQTDNHGSPKRFYKTLE